MKCVIGWCSEKINPAIGIANFKGKPGLVTAGTKGQYPLCRYHYEEARSGRWNSVIMLGFEEFPNEQQTN